MLSCGDLSRFSVNFTFIIMSFDTLGTIKADTNETALQGSLIRYGNQSAQIAFATGEFAAGSPTSRVLLVNNPLSNSRLRKQEYEWSC